MKPIEPVLDRRQAVRRVGGWVIYAMSGSCGLAAACGRTPLGDPFGLGLTDTPTPTPTPTVTGSPTATATPTCPDPSSVTGSNSGLLTTDVPANHVAYNAGLQIFLCNDGIGFYAMTSHCNHAGNDIGIQTPPGTPFQTANLAYGFHCQIHGAVYDSNGVNTVKPSGSMTLVGTLQHFKVSIDGTNGLHIDVSEPVDAGCRA